MTCFADVVRPMQKQWAHTYDLSCILLGSALIALFAQIAIPLPFTPVPVTLQSLAVLLLGAFLGSKRSVLAILAYLAEGSLGLPVFAGGGYGIAKLLGPSGGYFVGFLIAAFAIGFLLEKGWRKNFLLSFLALCIGAGTLLITGTAWLANFVGFEKALALGFYPFIIGDVAKVFLAASVISSGWKLLSYLPKNV